MAIEQRQEQLGKCQTHKARALLAHPAKSVVHKCGYPFLTKIVECYGPQNHRGWVFEVTCVLVGYWDEQRRQVFVCPGCGGELKVWWPYS